MPATDFARVPRRTLSALVVLVFAAISLVASSIAAEAGRSRIEIDPKQGPPGTAVTIKCVGFDADQRIDFFIENDEGTLVPLTGDDATASRRKPKRDQTFATTDENGGCVFVFIVPWDFDPKARGPRRIEARPKGGADNTKRASTFTVKEHDFSQPAVKKGPPARFGAAMAFDPSNQEAVMFGGGTSPTEGLDDTWTFKACRPGPPKGRSAPAHQPHKKKRKPKDVCAEFMHPSVSPSARDGATMDYLAREKVVIMFGGFHNGQALDETWWWNGKTEDWTQVHTDAAPSPRYGVSLFHVGRTIYLFGGSNGTQFFDDTWELDEVSKNTYTWAQLSPSTSPPARAFAGAASDSVAKEGVLFGGFNGVTDFNDTWCFQGGQWMQPDTPTSPSARSGMVFAYDPVIHASVLFGGIGNGQLIGDTWSLSSETETWTQLQPDHAPPPTAYAAGAFVANEFVNGIAINGGLVGVAPGKATYLFH